MADMGMMTGVTSGAPQSVLFFDGNLVFRNLRL